MELRNLYAFTPMPNTPTQNVITLQKALLRKGTALGIKGTILLAKEGINAAISAYSSESLEILQHDMEKFLNKKLNVVITNLKEKDPTNNALPFHKLKVRIRPEIVTLGVENVEPHCNTGYMVEPEHWNELIADPATLTIDTRNVYEYYLGHFKGAVHPHTNIFSEFVHYVEELQKIKEKYTRIAMYCTGGIRCEKASSYMQSLDFKNVYQLKGGILSYFQKIPHEQRMWEGVCFVFDDRIAINDDMTPSHIRYKDLPPPLHDEQYKHRHAKHIYKKILSITHQTT